ncbi:hypothetical protein PR048_000318 [Dryococelus australis]|uniref:Uncharacterized protein n=1 Tax=Dryococelus australis TaxID=614101 RepID=A0ABQ9IEA2_9NEOP|nr:hypothetical protein PR048_000318 [Dryococelus australis]
MIINSLLGYQHSLIMHLNPKNQASYIQWQYKGLDKILKPELPPTGKNYKVPWEIPYQHFLTSQHLDYILQVPTVRGDSPTTL